MWRRRMSQTHTAVTGLIILRRRGNKDEKSSSTFYASRGVNPIRFKYSNIIFVSSILL